MALVTTANATNMLNRLSIADNGRGSTARLEEATDDLILAAENVIAQARQVQNLIKNRTSGASRRVAALSSLRRETDLMGSHVQTFQNASESFVMDEIKYAGKIPNVAINVQPQLSRFWPAIRPIIQQHLEGSEQVEEVLWRIVEECYMEVTSDNGTLSVGRIRARSVNNRNSVNHKWIAFWIRALDKCDGGPTLFWPLDWFNFRGQMAGPPKFLFRAFDSDTYGLTDDTVVASSASVHVKSGMSRIDITSLSSVEAAQKLHAHLDPVSGKIDNSDNLVSWSSSLLSVIQYAIYRSRKAFRNIDDIKIIAVDTTLFPKGQFFKDHWLLEDSDCKNAANPRLRKLAAWRDTDDWDNGEHLSQGRLNHQGRSSTTTLGQLAANGLYDLYPEFADDMGAGFWTRRVKYLRSLWSSPQETCNEDVDLAFDVVDSCFPNLSSFNLALLLLCLKNRGYQTEDMDDDASANVENYRPIEVKRFALSAERINSRDDLRDLSDPDAIKEFLQYY